MQKITAQLSQSTGQLDAGVKAGFESVCSELLQSTSQLGTQVKSDLSTLTSQITSTEPANEERYHSILAHLNDHTKSGIVNNVKVGEVLQQQVRSSDINEAGFKAVHTSIFAASTSSSEEHKETHAMLRQCQGQLQQIIRDHIAFETNYQNVHSPPSRPEALRGTHTTSTVFWRDYRLRLPIGMLDINLSQTRQIRSSKHLETRLCAKSGLEVVFVPPRWLSSVVIKYSMNLCCDLISSEWRWGATLMPLTVNENLFFREAIRSLDLEDLRSSFSKGLAKPTDQILYRGFPVPWYWVCFRLCLQ